MLDSRPNGQISTILTARQWPPWRALSALKGKVTGLWPCSFPLREGPRAPALGLKARQQPWHRGSAHVWCDPVLPWPHPACRPPRGLLARPLPMGWGLTGETRCLMEALGSYSAQTGSSLLHLGFRECEVDALFGLSAPGCSWF